MVAPLSEQMASPEKRNALIDDALQVLDAEVADKSGLSGVAVKTAFKLVKGVQPGFLRRVVEGLLDEFLEKTNPLYQSALAAGLSPGGLLEKEKGQLASTLLSVTDARAERADSELVKKTYMKLRPTAQKHVEAAAPRLAGLLDRHAIRA
jgi:hypothetical protein